MERLRQTGYAMSRRAVIAAMAAFAAMGNAYAAPALDPVEPPARAAFDASAIRRGAELAAIGNCAGCHTARHGIAYAGGAELATPFGVVHGTNITPDAQTGIGNWSLAAFVRALREGVARDGSHLYPAFPYDHFTKLSEADLESLYAFVMTREPVRAVNRANALRLPFNQRPLIAVWNALYLDTTPWRSEPAQSAQWNRGAYLVQALGHCGACHTPRNALGAEDRRDALGGGEVEGWYAPALDAKSPSPLPWSVEPLVTYLRNGVTADHAVAGGPMQAVVHALSHVNEADVRAMAVYLVAVQGEPGAERQARAQDSQRRARQGPLAARPLAPAAAADEEVQLALGASVYEGACAVCHDAGRGSSSARALQLPLAVAVHAPDPRSLIRIVREGITPPIGEAGRWMPGFGDALGDEQIAALVIYLRRAASAAPAWPDVPRQVRQARAP